MKLRILGNRLRLRINEAEAGQLKELGVIVEEIAFSPETRLTYELRISEQTEAIKASFQHNSISVSLPSNIAKHWLDTAQISLAASVEVGADQPLSILVEKDLPCDHNKKSPKK